MTDNGNSTVPTVATSVAFQPVPDTNYMYNGQVIDATDSKGKTSFIMNGEGELLMFPYLYIGSFRNNVPHGKGILYYKPIAKVGEIVDFSQYFPTPEQKQLFMQNYRNDFSVIHECVWDNGKCQSLDSRN